MRRQIGTVLSTGLLMCAVALAPGLANAAVSSLPAATPQINAEHGTDAAGNPVYEQVRQIVQCGGTMYAVGNFLNVKNGNSTALIARSNAFAFSATAPYKVTNWNPNVNGTVDTVACNADGSVLLGGVFTSAGGQAVKNIARVDAVTGAGLPFNMKPGGRVTHIEVVGGHALVGGYFPKYLVSLNPTTGVPDNYINGSTVNIPITGNYSYPGVTSNPTRVWNMSVSPDQSAVLITGDFTSVGGQHHEQVVRLNLTTPPAVSAWAPSELYSHCATVEPFYAQDATWSPDMHTIYTANTGYKLYDDTNPTAHPRTGPCDAAVAYQADNQSEFSGHTWINYTGCDSLFAVAADTDTVFIAGHERYINNPNHCDTPTVPAGAKAQPGLGEISPSTGVAVPGPDRGRGLGADDLLRTSAGLWVASDDQANTDACAGKHGHMGICFLPD
jgi:hypothetical protein